MTKSISKRFIILYTLLLTLIPSQGSLASICESLSDDIPVLAGGRVKPYYVLAKESVKFLTGKAKFNNEEPTHTFCQILNSSRNKANLSLPLLVEHVETKKLLGLKDSDTFLGAQELIEKQSLIRSEILGIKDSSSYKKDLNRLYSRIELYSSIGSGSSFRIYTGAPEDPWQEASEFNELTNEEFAKLISESKIKYIKDFSDDYQLELTYVKSNYQGISLILALIGIFLTVLLPKLRIPVITAFLVLGVETIAFILRIMISGRAPITNMYETVMFSGYGALIISLILLYFKRDKIFLLAGLSYNMLCLFMMIFANGMLSSSISPLVPVLRDNFWLSTHVTTIILSYAALALSWIAANIALFKMKFGSLTSKEYRLHQDLIYACIKVGIILLAAGIILGGIWADYSWGRFWGWDPKETWSLIVLLFYMALVHGKSSSWINPHRFIILSAAGFMTVMMAWFGVNYILASGLHSYGFSEGGALFLSVFFVAQTLYLVICAKAKFKDPSNKEPE